MSEEYNSMTIDGVIRRSRNEDNNLPDDIDFLVNEIATLKAQINLLKDKVAELESQLAEKQRIIDGFLVNRSREKAE